MAVDKSSTSSNNPLEQFVILAKSTKGAATAELVRQVLSAPGVHVFGELLDMPSIKEMESNSNTKYYNTLNLFAYGTYKDYRTNRDQYLELTDAEVKKLQHLTLVTLATKTKCIPYSLLLQELELNNVRDLEDLIIEAIYADIIRGKLDQKSSELEVDYAIGRDIKCEELGVIIATLQDWLGSCEEVLSAVETQIQQANSNKTKALTHKQLIENEISNIKKTLKSQTQDVEEAMSTDSRESAQLGPHSDKLKKSDKIKSKMLKSSSKFWHK